MAAASSSAGQGTRPGEQRWPEVGTVFELQMEQQQHAAAGAGAQVVLWAVGEGGRGAGAQVVLWAVGEGGRGGGAVGCGGPVLLLTGVPV